MSFHGNMHDAKSAISAVEESEYSRSTKSSPVRDGASGPGGAASGVKPAGEHLEQKRTKLKTATSSLKRRG